MLVVADASILVVALAGAPAERSAVQSWLVGLTGGDRVYVLQNFTQLEYLSAIRKLSLQGKLTDRAATGAVRAFIELPSHRLEVTQSMALRIWEMRNNLTSYDAAYVALAERLQAERTTEVVVATDDARLANSSNLLVNVELFSRPRS